MLFIRIDNVGEWKGKDHKSFFSYIDGETEEGGISCYKLENEYSIEILYSYWKYDVHNTDSQNRQITIFEGNLIGQGSSEEDLAECIQTIKEIPASILFDNIEFFEDVEGGLEFYDEDGIQEISFNDDIFENKNKFQIIYNVIENIIKDN